MGTAEEPSSAGRPSFHVIGTRAAASMAGRTAESWPVVNGIDTLRAPHIASPSPATTLSIHHSALCLQAVVTHGAVAIKALYGFAPEYGSTRTIAPRVATRKSCDIVAQRSIPRLTSFGEPWDVDIP